MNVVIIEDELPALNRLKKMLEENSEEINIIGTADSIETGCQLFTKQKQIDLAFFDIELADGQSFDIFNRVIVYCPVIFTTAYDEFALKAFKLNSIDYLLKPIDKNELAHAIQKFSKLYSDHSNPLQKMQNLLQHLYEQNNYKNRFLIKTGNKLVSYHTDDMAYFLAHDKQVYTVLFEKEGKLIIDHTLDELEEIIDPKKFFRLNRQYLVNIKSIQTVNTHYSGKLKVDILPKPNEDVFVSKEKASLFKQWLNS